MLVSGKERIMKTVRTNKLGISRAKEPLHIGLVALLLIVLWSQTALAQPCGITQITNGDTFGAIIQKNNASINCPQRTTGVSPWVNAGTETNHFR